MNLGRTDFRKLNPLSRENQTQKQGSKPMQFGQSPELIFWFLRAGN